MKTSITISNQAARLKKIRLYLGMTRAQFGETVDISQFTIRSWENGLKNFTSNGVKRVVTSLSKKINFACSFDWLMHGIGSSPISLYEENNISDDEELQFDPLQEKILKEVITFKKLNKSASVIVVSDEKFLPIAHIGDYVGLVEIQSDRIDDHIGKVIFQNLEDSSSKLGILAKIRKNYSIKSLTQDTNSIIKSNSPVYLIVWLRKIF